MLELSELIDQLRLCGVEVAWVTALKVCALWSVRNRVLVLSASHDASALRRACRTALSQARPRQEV